MTSIVTVTSKNQITIPVKIVQKLGLSAGIRLLVRLENASLRMEKIPVGFKDLQGIVQKSAKLKHLTVEQARMKATQIEARRLMET